MIVGGARDRRRSRRAARGVGRRRLDPVSADAGARTAMGAVRVDRRSGLIGTGVQLGITAQAEEISNQQFGNQFAIKSAIAAICNGGRRMATF